MSFMELITASESNTTDLTEWSNIPKKSDGMYQTKVLFGMDSSGALASALFFCEALPNAFLENGFTREAPDGRIRFLLQR
jgi:hypothetical protein